VDALAAFDKDLITNLSSKARILVASPYDCLLETGIREDAPPRVILKPEHPLFNATWCTLSHVLRRWPNA
jgi:hypothetical protein